MIDFGLYDDVPTWLIYNSTLPKDFAEYAIKNKLGIQDKKLTDLEKKFLGDLNKYLQEMFDYNISKISRIDPELATQLKRLPYFKEIELEDVLYLANNPKCKSILEKLYGKGIEKKMHPVALEALLWRGMRDFKNEFDLNNPLERSDLKVLVRLTEFHEKYNKEMNIWGEKFKNENLVKKAVDDLVKVARQNYSGQVTYADWWFENWWKPGRDPEFDWYSMDFISSNLYIGKARDEDFLNYMLWKKMKYAKPFIVSETESLTVDKDEADWDYSYLWRSLVNHDPKRQAERIERQLDLIYRAEVDGIFVFCWDEPIDHPWGDMNKLGFGIWDHVKMEPKPSFFIVYKYFKDY